ncbi:monovalent cation/H+ antiporter subunit B [Methanolobus halotolerans]|uniref:Cation:proton antiporter n=1 Tax=Methanolobus halotolerans TaxID=2052935 RepID=A0A4E0PTC9_9EURY|nr:monovalent cation/H+ antiporter subunit B [Methanolobus halotolerans]TGC07912.1 cation:proton antiporter [Methanolobus halotolerans]
MTTIITKTVTRICLPLVILFSISLLLAGHNNPGGGFIGGVMFASVIALTYIVFGIDHIRSFFNPDWADLFASGLLLASLTAFAALPFGHNFFRSAVEFLHLPFFGEVELVSAALFDLGVYFVVIGSLLSVLKNVGDDK